MRRLPWHVACTVLFAAGTASCSAPLPFLPAPSTATLAAWPTFTSTPPAATPLPTVGATAEAGPSPTPFKHVVRKNETLLGIAAMYGVSLDALLAVNPGVDPFVLSIGQELLIPGPEGTPVGSLVPTATPIPLALQPPTCYRKPSGGWWCLGAVRNPTAQDLENLVVEIRLEAAGGGEAQTQQVFPPLNRLPAGETMPVAASFPDNGQDTASASALVQGVIPARDSETRYTVPAVELATNARQAGGRAWQVGGVVTADAKAPEPNRTLVLVTAFDDAGRVVGYAVWEADPTMGPGEKRQFDAQVFSLGPEIARVSLLAESYALTSGEG